MTATISTENLMKLSDSALYQKCKEYGLNARLWLRKFAGLLLEVNRRRLYKKKGYASLYEFAAKLAGMNQGTVDKILGLAKRLANKPQLLHQLETGEFGWSKLEKVSFIATSETDQTWAEKVKNLDTRTLEAYVKELRKNEQPMRLDFAHVNDA